MPEKEIKKLERWMAIYALVNHDPDPEWRRELLKEFDTCSVLPGLARS